MRGAGEWCRLLLGVGVSEQSAKDKAEGEASDGSPGRAAKEMAADMLHEQKMTR